MTSLIPQGFYTHFLVKGTELISDDSVNLPLSCDGDSESSRGEVIVGECKIVLDDNLSVCTPSHNLSDVLIHKTATSLTKGPIKSKLTFINST